MNICTAVTGIAGVLVVASGIAAQPPAPLGPTPYACFGDSPFAGLVESNSIGYLYLETFEIGSLSTPGASTNGVVIGPGVETDSVDCDDAVTDGSGQAGHSLYRAQGYPAGITIGFDATALPGGRLPTHVGIVWTDGATASNILFQAFNAQNILAAEVSLILHGDGSLEGGTAEDRFFGVIDPSGISSIRVTSRPNVGSLGTGIELDHLQYGGGDPILPPPCPVEFNHDGSLNADDLGDFITLYFELPHDALSDFNHDGEVNADDLGDYITAYFEGC